MRGERQLWCPVRRRYLADRPEERVRLAMIEHLRRRGCPLSVIQVEYWVGAVGRFDLAVFTRGGEIWLLMECKEASSSQAQLDRVMKARAQLNRYARALEGRWKVHYLGLAIGESLYYLHYPSQRWISSLPPYPRE